MITYLYWATTAFIAISLLLLFVKNKAYKTGIILFLTTLILSWAAYFFHFEQMFVKRFGGVMNVTVKANEYHLHSTWKDDNLWIESYNPETQTCHFREYSKGNLLQGSVTIRNCRPLIKTSVDQPRLPAPTIRSEPTTPAATSTHKNPATPSAPKTLDDMDLSEYER